MAQKGSYYITTPIYYPSDKLHIGHAYTTTAADTIARFKKLQGYDVRFVTGSDEHGQKIERIAIEKGKSPKEYVDEIVATFKALWKRLDISYDDFVRTTEPRHQRVVQEIFKRIYDNGDIYKGEYEGWYCTPCETHWLERQLVDGKCPDCNREVELLKEESYYFDMPKYKDKLLNLIEENPDFIKPSSRKNEMLSFIKDGLEPLCISRTTFKWGIPVPIDDGHVIYVWFDALSNYLTGVGWLEEPDKYRKYWPCDVHLVGKEIVRFHSLIWPAMLMAIGVEPPKQIFGHGWLVVEGDKMSKSRGNVVDPNLLIDEFGSDTIRYFLLREIVFGQDGNFSRTALINRTNADLANDLGNLVNRTEAMVTQFFEGEIPTPGEGEGFDLELVEAGREMYETTEGFINKLELNMAVQEIWKFIRRTNKYIDQTEPWILARHEDKRERLGRVIYNLAEALRLTSLLLYPFIPQTGKKIWERLGQKTEITASTYDNEMLWGRLKPGTRICPGDPLFPRIEEDIELEKETKETGKDEISIDYLSKLNIRVGEVTEAEQIKGSRKLLKLKVDIGGELRQIVAGIAEHYTCSELLSKKVAVIVNLKPAKIMGVESQGMLFAASNEKDALSVITVDKDIETGAVVR